MPINPEKMQAFKEKYALDDEAIEEIANAAEPRKVSVQEIAESGEQRESTQPRGGGILFNDETVFTPEMLKALGNGDSDMKEVFNMMLISDMMEDRRERRAQRQNPQGDSTTKVLDEMRRMQEDFNQKLLMQQANTEKLILGKKIEDVSTENQKLREELKERDKKAEERQSYDQLRAEYDAKLNAIVNQMQSVPAERQKSFMDEILEGVTGDIQGEIRTAILDRFKGKPAELPNVLKTDDKGGVAIDYMAAFNRVLGTVEKGIEAYAKTHPGTVQVPPLGPFQQRVLTETFVPPQNNQQVLREAPPSAPVEVPPQANIVVGGTYEKSVEAMPKIVPGTIHGAEGFNAALSLRELAGVDQGLESQLFASGIMTVRDLAATTPEAITHLMPPEKALDLIKQARDLVDRAA